MTLEMRNDYAADLSAALVGTGIDPGIAGLVAAEYTEMVDGLAEDAAALIVGRKVVLATGDHPIAAELRRAVAEADAALSAFRAAAAQVLAAAEAVDQD